MNHKFFRKFFFLAKQSKHVRSSHRSDLKLKIIHGRFTKISSTLSKKISKSVVFFGQIPENLTKYRLNSSDSILISIVITLHLSLTVSDSRMNFHLTIVITHGQLPNQIDYPRWVSLGCTKQLTGSSRWCIVIICKACNEFFTPAP